MSKKQIRLGIVGSTGFKDKNRMWFEVNELRKIYDVILIVSGEAPGADTLTKEYAQEKKIKYKGHKAQWDDMPEPCLKRTNQHGEYNALAGFKRNTLIINDIDYLLAFRIKMSPGTTDSVNKAKKFGKLLKVIELNA